MKTQEERKTMMRRAFEDMDSAMIKNNIGQDYVLHLADGTDIVGVDQYIKFLNALVAAIPDIKYKVEDIVVDGDIIAIRACFTGTNTGPLRGIPPTGRKVSMREAFFFRLEGDKVVEEWSFLNYMALMQQLGLAPSAGQASG